MKRRARTNHMQIEGIESMVPTTKRATRGTASQKTVLPTREASCGCGAHSGTGRTAVAVDADGKERNLKRLRRIEGQARGIQKMIEEDRYCADILTQISSVHEALRAVARELMRNHLKHCATAAIRADGAGAEAMYDELVELMYTHSR